MNYPLAASVKIRDVLNFLLRPKLDLPLRKDTVTAALLSTGGTIGSSAQATGGPINVVNGGKNLIGETLAQGLAAENINLKTLSSAYNILSENIDPNYVTKLATSLIELINAKQPDHIVVSHGTDSMNEVVNLLSRDTRFPLDICENKAKNLSLNALIRDLQDTIQQKRVSVVFTGANTTEAEEREKNMSFAFLSAKGVHPEQELQRANYDAQSRLYPGIYIAFHDKLIRAETATKDIFNPSLGMRYADHEDSEYQRNLARLRLADTQKIKQLKTELLGDDSQNLDLKPVLEYEVNKIRENHDDFLEKLDKSPEVKAILLVLYHSGTANTNSGSEASVLKMLQKIREKHPAISVFAVNENPGEPVTLGETSYAGANDLLKNGVIPLDKMHRSIALAKIAMLIQKNPEVSKNELKESLRTN